MIFAICDYYRYARRTGKYSPEKMCDQNLILANADNFPSDIKLSDADLLFVSTSGSLLSWLVMYYTNSVISHVATLTKEGDVYDCTTNGVIKHHLRNYLDNKSYLGIASVKGEFDSSKTIEFLEKQIGKSYAWGKVIRLFFLHIFGLHRNFSWKWVGDFLLMAATILLVSYLVAGVTSKIVLLLTANYLIFVVFARIYMRRIMDNE